MVITVCLVTSFPLTAFAGTNGQQLAVYTCNTQSLGIEGTNHNGVYTGASFRVSTTCGWKYINNWWWKGSVKITAYRTNGSAVGKSVLIPAWQVGDWVFIGIG